MWNERYEKAVLKTANPVERTISAKLKEEITDTSKKIHVVTWP